MRDCLVTGGANGIGKAIASRLASRGYSVTALDRDLAGLSTLDERIGKMHADLRYVSNLPHFDVLVINAAIFGQNFDIREMLEVNFLCNIPLIERLPDGGQLIVVSTASYLGAEVSVGMSKYLASKAALSAYCKGLTKELDLRSISVHEILCNDSFDTPMGRQAVAEEAGISFLSPEMIADAAEMIVDGALETGTILRVDREGIEVVQLGFFSRSGVPPEPSDSPAS